MSTVTVQRTFKTLTSDLRLTNREARQLLAEARKGPVTGKEAALIGSIAKRAVTADPRLARITKGGFFAAKSTVSMLESFATRHADRHGMPTADQLKKIYTNLANAQLAAGNGKQISGPPVANPNDWPSYDMTPKGLMDVTKTLYVIQGQLIFRTSGMGPGGITSQWKDLGPAPLF